MPEGGSLEPVVRERIYRVVDRGREHRSLTLSERLLVRLAEAHVLLHPEIAFAFRFDNLEWPLLGTGRPVRVAFLDAASTCRRIFTGGSIALGDCFCEGKIEVEDADYADFLLLLVRAVYDPHLRHVLPLTDRAWLYGAGIRGVPTSRETAGANINCHYSLSDWVDDETSNRFYLVWLDERHHQYSSGLWRPETATVEEAQETKFRRYCERLGLFGNAAGRTLLELGCGWGGFLFHAARRHNLRAHGITLATAQARFIREEATRSGLENRVTVTRGDVHDLSGTWNHIVSIGLLEHIADREALFDAVADALAPGGTVLFHAMFHEKSRYRPDPWLTRHIFPGGGVPNIVETLEALRARFAVVEREDLPPLSYPKTLAAWRKTFRRREPELRRILAEGGCAEVERVLRIFRHYLALAEAGLTVDGFVSSIACRDPLPAAERSAAREAARSIVPFAPFPVLVPEPEP